MTTKQKVEKHAFQTEVKQLLHLMINSLYTHKEIFLRELISNASDACDKLRFEALTDSSLYGDDDQLKIEVEINEEANTITIRDNGIGMNKREVIANIGTIAQSGTAKFMEKMKESDQHDASMIGQFGVGFYSSFLVADEVVLITRRAGSKTGIKWVSKGDGEYTLETVKNVPRGTEITLHLREDAGEYVSAYRVREVIKKYSDHIATPILMPKAEIPGTDDEEQEKDTGAGIEWEQVNGGTPIWARPKNKVKAEEYDSFYTGLTYDPEPPAMVLHNRVEGNLEYSSLFFVPSKAPFDMWDREQRHGVKLYVKRVFISDDAKNLMPNYLRFVRGLVDAEDLPLNISREFLQDDPQLAKIRNASVKKILAGLKKIANKDSEKYQQIWNEFGKVLKEGVAEDHANHDRITPLLRFASTHTDNEEQTVSFADYINRMDKDQDEIYFITAENYAAAKASPHLEIFNKRGKEVLLLTDPIDEWVVNQLTEVDGKTLKSIAKGDVDFGEDEGDKKLEEKKEKALKPLLEKIKEALGDEVKEVKISSRLVDSPSCLIADQFGMGGNMERIMKAMGQDMPEEKPILEINPDHALIKNLEKDESNLDDWAHILFDQAALAEGAALKDPGAYVKRINKLLVK
jgi:molecular chaperone HtpG